MPPRHTQPNGHAAANSVTAERALVVATYSRRMRLQPEHGEPVEARIKGKRLRPVCGDHVLAERIPDEPDWMIVEVLPRKNELSRPDYSWQDGGSRGQCRPVAGHGSEFAETRLGDRRSLSCVPPKSCTCREW